MIDKIYRLSLKLPSWIYNSRNFFAKKFKKITWYGGFYCDWCGRLDRNWHIVRIKENGQYDYHHLLGNCIKNNPLFLRHYWNRYLYINDLIIANGIAHGMEWPMWVLKQFKLTK